MSELPKGWRTAEGDEIFQLMRGVTYDKEEVRTEAALGLVPVLRANNIEGGHLNRNELVFVPERYVRQEQKLRAHDFVVASSSGSRSVVGKAGAATAPFWDAAFGAFCTVIRPRLAELAPWLGYFLKSRSYRDFVEHVALGTNINNLRSSDLRAVVVPLPPMAEQQRIVGKLDAVTARTAQARADLDRVPMLAERQRSAILTMAFSGGLSAPQEEEPNNQPAEWPIEIDRRIEPTVALPVGWRWSAFGRSCLITSGLTKNAARASGELEVPYLRVANVYANELRLSEILTIGCSKAEFAKTELLKGDLLIVEGNGSIEQIGRVAVWNGEVDGCSHQNHLIRARPGPDVLSKFALYWLMSPKGRRAIETVATSGAGLHTLSISKVSGLPLPICDVEVQQQIVDRIEHAFAEIDRLVSEAAAARRLLDRLDHAILAKAFRGELVPQDPADEPASTLLDHIRAERAAAPTKSGRGRRTMAA